MKLLGLLRHAKSDWDDVGLKDFDRGLNARGRKGAALMGQHISDYGVAWDRVIASPAQRVKSTLEASGLPGHVTWDERLYLALPDTMLTVLEGLHGDPANVLMVAHNPGLQELIFKLVSADAECALFDAAVEKFPTATFAVLECDISSWEDIRPGCARLIHLTRPRDLDPELGPID